MNHITETVPSSQQEWEALKPDILREVQSVMGAFPSIDRSKPPVWTVTDETPLERYVRLRIVYEADPGCETTAFLCIPNEPTGKGSLCLHPTNHNHGYEDVVGLSGRPNRNYASELAERGCVTISPSYPLMAGYQPDLAGLGYVSGTMKAIWDNIRALDLLSSLDEVTDNVFSAIGHSLGGHNSVYTAVFDDRIQATVSNCGLDSYLDYYNWEPGNGWSQKRYMPRIGSFGSPEAIPFDFHDLIASLAPRACLVSAPMGDTNFKWQSAAAIVDSARSIYRLYKADSSLQIIHPDCPHDFPPDVREQCYAFLEKHLTLGVPV